MTTKEAFESIIFQKRDNGYISDAYRNDISKVDKALTVLKEFERMLDANTLCRICGVTGYKIIDIFKSNSIIKNWLENSER